MRESRRKNLPFLSTLTSTQRCLSRESEKELEILTGLTHDADTSGVAGCFFYPFNNKKACCRPF